MDHAPLPARQIIYKGHRDITGMVIPQQVTHQHLPGAPGADDQHPLATAEIQTPILEPAIEEARPRQEQRSERSRTVTAGTAAQRPCG
jgi:hypothetical protein